MYMRKIKTKYFDEYYPNYDIFALQKKCEMIADSIIYYNNTIRQAADNLNISKSTVHAYIHSHIKGNMQDEYFQIVEKLKWNKRNRFKPRKYW